MLLKRCRWCGSSPGGPAESRRPASSIRPFSSRPDTLDEESTRTCSMKAGHRLIARRSRSGSPMAAGPSGTARRLSSTRRTQSAPLGLGGQLPGCSGAAGTGRCPPGVAGAQFFSAFSTLVWGSCTPAPACRSRWAPPQAKQHGLHCGHESVSGSFSPLSRVRCMVSSPFSPG